ncbi:integration host factor subunit alpha [Candidatus Phycosocius spiralis]|uniref:Integration host factor subunit alpha n=1 Tax=Candidatus Phycosocius spiralis TaxID=2815099 RepID=A0ABQ4PYH5_9PROT|nr:integration host factor subunit alpha [Candidatus Phycosocius spiralis]GIU67986.1 integration host factor subunit alpha [Candidatus Phycosocius spiralis]
MGKTLTRADLIEALGREVGLSRSDCSDLLESLLEHLVKTLERGHIVKLARFGNFTVRSKSPRIGRNPKTGVEATISARRVVSFKASQLMRERVEKG